jgi:hypothetical protein
MTLPNGLSKGVSFELAQHCFGIEMVLPRGIATNCTSRSLPVAGHNAYAALLRKLRVSQSGGQ